jgi:ATP synthase F1 delta subunit
LKTVKGVKKYAKKFLGNVEMAEVPAALDQLGTLVRLMEKDKDFKTLLVSPLFSSEEKQKSLAFVGGKVAASDKVLKYLAYLSDEKAIIGLPEIVKTITALYMEMKKQAKAVVTAPAALSADYQAQLKAALSKVTGKDIEISVVTDPSLIGGLRIRLGSTMYDSSIKGQLSLLKDKFIEG